MNKIRQKKPKDLLLKKQLKQSKYIIKDLMDLID